MTVQLWSLGCQMIILRGSLAFLEILDFRMFMEWTVLKEWSREQLCLQPHKAETVYSCRAMGQARLFLSMGDSGS